MNILKLNLVEEKIVIIRGIPVILDSDVAELYEVETKRINEAVKNNPEKFPNGYLLDLSVEEYKSLRSNFSTLENQGRGKHVKYLPKAFTEKGLYMLATILKSSKATQTTIDIVETFAKLREFSRAVSQLAKTEDEPTQKSLMQKSGEIIADILGDDLEITDTETTWEINFALMKFRRTVRQKKK
ncbi:MAG: ORF6N domain-containing protein [Bacteroidetes bacterium]|nr:ORF6N domain-containing protein [Bacteroidota bacterium]MCL2302252.1 ORF6N domain-containing protein [Lentimicrobiaceae bacterium]